MKNPKSTYFIAVVSLVIGLLHFVVGPNYSGPGGAWVAGYLMDLLLPVSVYLLSQIVLRKSYPLFKSRIVGAVGTLGIGITVEVLQWQGIPLFGSTYDPIDIVMYVFGTGIGLMLDKSVVDRWESEKEIQ